MKKIALPQWTARPFSIFDTGWFLVSAGDFASNRWNSMTVSWGFLGTMWSKPVAQIVIRPQRYTREFLDESDTFTLSAFPAENRTALQYLGTHSGRDGDKVAAAGLTPMAAPTVAAPAFREASLVLECRKLFRQPMTADSFLDKQIAEANYPTGDFHIQYIGEVLGAYEP